MSLTDTDTPRQRCAWVAATPLYQAYHDHEWGNPCFEGTALFEALMLETLQAGLSWATVLKKREAYRQVFADFDPACIILTVDNQLEQLMQDARLIRHRQKYLALAHNARCYQQLLAPGFDWPCWLWDCVDGEPIVNHWRSVDNVPVTSTQAHTLHGRLKSAGFTFLGPKTCYAFMQAVGMVRDHHAPCWLAEKS